MFRCTVLTRSYAGSQRQALIHLRRSLTRRLPNYQRLSLPNGEGLWITSLGKKAAGFSLSSLVSKTSRRSAPTAAAGNAYVCERIRLRLSPQPLGQIVRMLSMLPMERYPEASSKQPDGRRRDPTKSPAVFAFPGAL